MDASLDLKTFKDAVESMKRILKNGKLTIISYVRFDSAVATVNEICLRRVNSIDVNSEIKYNIDELKKNFEKYKKFSSLSIGSMYHQKCAEKVESLDNLYTNFEATITNKKRPPTETIDYAPETFRAIRVSVYGDQNDTNTSLTELNLDESNFETKIEKIEDEVINNESSIVKNINENILMVETKSTIQDTKTASSKVEPSANVYGEHTNPIQDEKISSNNPNGNSSVSLTLSNVEEEKFPSVIALEAILQEKTKELANRTQESSTLIEEREMAYHELKLANKEFEKRQEALSVLQNEVFVRFPQDLTEMLSSHHQLIRGEFAELKNEVKNMGEVLLAANKDLRQHIEAQEITINILKSELQTLKTTMKEVLKKKDEEVGQVINQLNDLLKVNDKCGFCSNQTDEEESRNKKAKVHKPNKINVHEDTLEAM